MKNANISISHCCTNDIFCVEIWFLHGVLYIFMEFLHGELCSTNSTVATVLHGDFCYIIHAFSYYAVSRSSYERLRKDYQLPSVSTLARITITSSSTKSSCSEFLKTVFEATENKRKPCVLLHDEVYFKKSLQYHGGVIFGKAVNDPSLLAETMLGQMINYLQGGKTFLVSMWAVEKMNANFLH